MSVRSEFSLPEYKNFDGCLLPYDFFTVKERIEHFEVRESDIWIASYPKAGATWLQELVWLLCNNLDYDSTSIDMDERFPYIEVNSLYKSLEEFHRKHNIFYSLNESSKPLNVFNMLNKNANIRFIKTHLPWNLLPRQIKDGIKNPKIIYVLRHPKDIMPLYYDHMKNVFQAYKGTKNTFFELYTQGKLLYGNYFANVLSYWNRRHSPNLMIVTYEDMCCNMKAVAKKVAEFLGKNYPDKAIDELIQYLNFSDTKQSFAYNDTATIQENGKEIVIRDFTDNSHVEFSQDLSEKFDIWVFENLHNTGLPYEITKE